MNHESLLAVRFFNNGAGEENLGFVQIYRKAISGLTWYGKLNKIRRIHIVRMILRIGRLAISRHCKISSVHVCRKLTYRFAFFVNDEVLEPFVIVVLFRS